METILDDIELKIISNVLGLEEVSVYRNVVSHVKTLGSCLNESRNFLCLKIKLQDKSFRIRVPVSTQYFNSRTFRTISSHHLSKQEIFKAIAEHTENFKRLVLKARSLRDYFN